jgi:hypothetical protein
MFKSWNGMRPRAGCQYAVMSRMQPTLKHDIGYHEVSGIGSQERTCQFLRYLSNQRSIEERHQASLPWQASPQGLGRGPRKWWSTRR